MTDLSAQQLQALRAHSLDRHLSQIGGAQGPTIEIVGQELVNFSSNDSIWRKRSNTEDSSRGYVLPDCGQRVRATAHYRNGGAD
jgi:hypothetical protein